MADFDGRVIVITGVGREGQLGEVVARAFAEEGAQVALVDRDAEAVRGRAVALGAPARAYACDLTVTADATRVAAAIAADFGPRAHALVNLAGGFGMSGPVAESDVDVLARQLAINLTTAYVASRAFLPALRVATDAAGDARGGAVVYVASAAVLPDGSGANMSAYAAAKSGVLALMRAVAQEERAHGIRANAVAPTAIRTGDNVAAMGADGMAYVERESVAAVVQFLCADASRNVSGQVLKLA